jgi:hypothetical protein
VKPPHKKTHLAEGAVVIIKTGRKKAQSKLLELYNENTSSMLQFLPVLRPVALSSVLASLARACYLRTDAAAPPTDAD